MPLELHLDPQVCLIKILDPGTFIILEYGSWIPELESWITAVSALHGHRLFTVQKLSVQISLAISIGNVRLFFLTSIYQTG